MRSKNRLTYDNRMLHYKADLELVDIICKANSAGELSPDDMSTLFLHMDTQKHRVLSKRKVGLHNRNMAVYHLRQTVYGAFIKDIYEELYRFLKSTIFETVQNLKADPDRLIGEHKISLSAKEILKLEDITAVNEKIIDALFQTLEAEQSTIKLISKTRDKLGLDFDATLIDEALPYLELRHKLVHTDGKLDADFVAKFPNIPRTASNYADLRFSIMKEANDKISELVAAIDNDALSKKFVKPHIPND